eukprot:GHUV01016899.1.p1 GENE.GHUV01016899.1~~GHUV01016899.1.p1  ORF type:complete len:172 (-),score=55.43 GHUV01016899.1:982-1497(-)
MRDAGVKGLVSACFSALKAVQKHGLYCASSAVGGNLNDNWVLPLQAALPTQQATYDQKWAALDAWPANRPITFRDIPWPAVTAPKASGHRVAGPQQQQRELQIDLAKLRTLVFGGATGPAALKVALRKELMRWHPDKFGARFGSRLAASDRESVLAGVQAVAQQLTALKLV